MKSQRRRQYKLDKATKGNRAARGNRKAARKAADKARKGQIG